MDDLLIKSKKALQNLREESKGKGQLPTGDLNKTHDDPFGRAAIVLHCLDGKLVEEQESLEIAKHLLIDDFVKRHDESNELYLCTKCNCGKTILICEVLELDYMIKSVKEVISNREALCNKCNGPFFIKENNIGVIDITNLFTATYAFMNACKDQEILSKNEILLEIACENIYYSTQPELILSKNEATEIKEQCQKCGFKVIKRKPIAYQPQIVIDECYRQLGTVDVFNLYLNDIFSVLAGLWAGAYGQNTGIIEACSGYILPTLIDYANFFGDLSIPVAAWSLKGMNKVSNKFLGGYPFCAEISKATYFHLLYKAYNYPSNRTTENLERAMEARAIGVGAYVATTLGAILCGFPPTDYRYCGWAIAIIHDSIELCHDKTYGESDNIVSLISGKFKGTENFDLPSVLLYLYNKGPKTKLFWRVVGGCLASHVVLVRYGILDHRRRFMKVHKQSENGWDSSILKIMPDLVTTPKSYENIIGFLRKEFNINVNNSEYTSTMEILNNVCLNNSSGEKCDKIRNRLQIGIWNEGSDDIVGACAEWLLKHLCSYCLCQPLDLCMSHTGSSILK